MITKGSYLDEEFVLGELYVLDSGNRIFRLTNISNNDKDLVQAYPDRRYKFTFTPVIEMSIPPAIVYELNTTAPEYYKHVSLLDLLQVRLKLDKFIIEESKLRGTQ